MARSVFLKLNTTDILDLTIHGGGGGGREAVLCSIIGFYTLDASSNPHSPHLVVTTKKMFPHIAECSLGAKFAPL